MHARLVLRCAPHVADEEVVLGVRGSGSVTGMLEWRSAAWLAPVAHALARRHHRNKGD